MERRRDRGRAGRWREEGREGGRKGGGMGRGGGGAAEGGRDAGWVRGTSVVWVGCRAQPGVMLGQGGAGRGGAERKERRNTTAIYGNGSGRTQSSSKTCFILRPQGPQPSQKLLKHRAEDMLVERRDWSRKERVWTTAPRGLVGEGGSRRHNGDVDQAMTAATAATATATAPTAAAAFAPTT